MISPRHGSDKCAAVRSPEDAALIRRVPSARRKEAIVTDGLAILAAWLMFGALLLALAMVILTGGPKP